MTTFNTAFNTAFTVNFIVLMCNPFAWLLIGLSIYCFKQRTISVPFKIVLCILYGFYLVFQIYLSMFVGGMAGGAPGVPEYYGTLLLNTMYAFLGAMGILVLSILIKR